MGNGESLQSWPLAGNGLGMRLGRDWEPLLPILGYGDGHLEAEINSTVFLKLR